MTEVVYERGVPPSRFYTVIVIVAISVGILTYLAGVKQGDTSCLQDFATVEVINQKRVYENDIKVDKDKPDSNDIDEWASSLLDALPFFSD